MKIFVETQRLILREMQPGDEDGLFELDADPEVHRYLGNKPIHNIRQARQIIDFIRQQYIDNGIGRWAVLEKSTNNFIGWSGLKLVTETINNHNNFYDLGYRLIRKYWGYGFATETAEATLQYGFDFMELPAIYAMADCENKASNNVLAKVGFRQDGSFDLDGIKHYWYTISKSDWLDKKTNAESLKL